ncbi:MAG: ABC transporter ATP-binding protein, partial [Pannonibacter indicus]
EKAAKAEKAPAPAATEAKSSSKVKLSFTQLHLLKTLPETVDSLTKKLEKLQAEMADPNLYAKSPDRFAKLSAEITRLTGERDAAEEQWLELEMLREEAEG